MHVFLGIATVGSVISATGPVWAQSAIEGPLAAPTAKPSPNVSTGKSASHRKLLRTAHHKPANDGASPGYTVDASAQEHPVPSRTLDKTPDDPLSLGMKWNGSNDSARDTRVQNYNGSASGSGAEVGLKLHF